MVILDIYGETKEIIISEKLDFRISSSYYDWQDGIQDDILEELHFNSYEVLRNSRLGIDSKEFDLRRILGSDYYEGIFIPSDDEELNIKEIARNLNFAYISDIDNSLLGLKEQELCNPTCEKAYEEKLLKFLQFLHSHNNSEHKVYLNYIYSSSLEINSKPRIIQNIDFSRKFPSRSLHHKYDFDKKLKNLKEFGSVLDSYLNDESDFRKLDYLINVIYEDNEYNPFHLFKLITVIEMLIVNPKCFGKMKSEMKRKLPQFLNEDIFENRKMKEAFSDYIRVIRNKIAHGDFKSLSKKLEEYASVFMKNYWFDYFEYSRENWIYLNICCTLDNIVSKLIWKELTCKDEMDKLRLS